MYKKLGLFTVIFVFIDQITKGIVNIVMNVNESISVISSFFNITYVHNYGAAFSMFSGSRYLLILFTIIALNLIFLLLIRNKELNKFEIVVYSMLIGGIIGNLVDRVMFGYVIDFLDFTIFGCKFAIFNIADSCIVISVILLVIQEVLYAKNRRRRG